MQIFFLNQTFTKFIKDAASTQGPFSFQPNFAFCCSISLASGFNRKQNQNASSVKSLLLIYLSIPLYTFLIVVQRRFEREFGLWIFHFKQA